MRVVVSWVAIVNGPAERKDNILAASRRKALNLQGRKDWESIFAERVHQAIRDEVELPLARKLLSLRQRKVDIVEFQSFGRHNVWFWTFCQCRGHSCRVPRPWLVRAKGFAFACVFPLLFSSFTSIK